MARPAEFNRDDVIEKAMNVFWRTGYASTSISDLVSATSLKPGSLYGAFKSKRDLFIEVVDTYAERSIQRVTAMLQTTPSPIGNIEHFFGQVCEEMQKDDKGQGCLLVNTMLELATEDDFIRERVSAYLDKIENAMLDTLNQAVEKGELDKSTNTASSASYLITSLFGLRVLSSKRPAPDTYKAITATMLSALHKPQH